MTGRIVVTGADGYLGRRIAARLLADTAAALVLTVRAAGRDELGAKRALLLTELAGPGGPAAGEPGRVRVLPADLRDPAPFAAIDPAGVTAVVHTAARTAFNVPADLARTVNAEGTDRVAGFARSCPDLERLLVLSTLFSAGRVRGRVREVPHPPAGDDHPGFANHYEWSKAAAERHLLDDCADLPLTIARLATVVADDEGGTVTQHNAFHNTLKLFFYGLLSLLPGDPATPLYLADADFTSRGAAHLLRPEVPGGVYHLAPGPDEVLPLHEAVGLAFDTFEADAGFRRRRLLRPELCDLDAFRHLVAASGNLSASPMAQALASVAPFAEQLFLPKEFDSSRLTAGWPGYRAPAARPLAEATCAWLVRTRWGRTLDTLEERTA